MKKFLIFITFLLFLVFAGEINAQERKIEPCLVVLQKLQIDYEGEKVKSESKDSQLLLKDELITSLNGHIATLEKIIANVDKQNTNNDRADVLTQQIISELRLEILAYKQEVESLRKRVDREKFYGNVKAGIGLGGGYLLGKKSN